MANTKNVLKSADQFRLMKLIEANFVASKLSDDDFAQLATKELGLTVTEGNVFHSRKALGFESNKLVRRVEESKQTVLARLAALEERFDRLERELRG